VAVEIFLGCQGNGEESHTQWVLCSCRFTRSVLCRTLLSPHTLVLSWCVHTLRMVCIIAGMYLEIVCGLGEVALTGACGHSTGGDTAAAVQNPLLPPLAECWMPHVVAWIMLMPSCRA
jgi:hypothetical protein